MFHEQTQFAQTVRFYVHRSKITILINTITSQYIRGCTNTTQLMHVNQKLTNEIHLSSFRYLIVNNVIDISDIQTTSRNVSGY